MNIKFIQSTKQQKSIKLNIKINKEKRYKATLTELRTHLDENEKHLNDITREKGVSNWLKPCPISDQGYYLNKQQFWYCVRLRNGWRLTNIPSTCSCGSKMDIQHAMSCKKGGFITTRHNISVTWLQICKDVNMEPQLLRVTGDTFENQTANTSTKQGSI